MTTLITPVPVVQPALDLDDNGLFEIIDGQRMEMPPMSAYAGRIASRLVSSLNEYSKPLGLGEAVMEVLFHLSLPVDRNRRPDVAFVSTKRWPKGKPQPKEANAWDVVPNLGVEVISPHDLAEEIMDKIDEYFRSDVELVWVVYPRHCLVYVYESLTRVHILTRKETLGGGTVLPGFQLPLAHLFLEEEDLSSKAD